MVINYCWYCTSLYPIRNKSVSEIAWLDHYVRVMTSASLISQVLLLSKECWPICGQSSNGFVQCDTYGSFKWEMQVLGLVLTVHVISPLLRNARRLDFAFTSPKCLSGVDWKLIGLENGISCCWPHKVHFSESIFKPCAWKVNVLQDPM